MKKNKLIMKCIYFLFVALVLNSCTEDFTEINTNEKELTTDAIADDVLLLGQVFAQAQYGSMFQSAYYFQYAQNWNADLYVQYFAMTTPDAEADRNDFADFWSAAAWSSFYSDCAAHVKAVEDISLENGNSVGNAMAKILKVLSYSRMTDHYGPIMYSQFGNGESAVAYDTQESMYTDFFVQLDEAVSVLKANPGAEMFSSSDRMFGGSADKWLKFANSLRLRLAIHIHYADSAKAKLEAEKAIADGVFTDSSEDAFVSFSDTNRSPYPKITPWGEFRMSAAMESVLKGYEDPRIPTYFSEAVLGDSDGDGLAFEGLLNGQSQSALSSPPNDDYSNMSLPYLPLEVGGTNGDYEVMTAAEVYFLRAEGALQGWNMGGTSEQMYENGIRASLTAKSDVDETFISAYINSSNTPVPYEAGTLALTDIPVAFSSDPETQLEQIMTQKWISLYPNGWEAWVDLRRTGYPKMYDRLFSDNPDVGTDEIMRRIKYPGLEADTNPEGLSGALALPEMQGGDKNSTKVWWDKK
ncbi:SusD/RagB family nutrient-binding outer membrane lipoprotein [Arenibacter sp. F26102]|uniref:SusD/RagB family nutrient-binding outer membrane lipoprotein n=1 Tax=Arenibacter sp. F26102 TaxID=2926416 RepID=UPI001FF4CF3C|nr:SusD/RagB family nutrient-binding outer membrane lipoprotein [Arenibacter sp. F26102]MCK0144941.1 SusD/RagB family nutrient-binding outer membrane lipoprotein [Arenibacter sp. F26102]